MPFLAHDDINLYHESHGEGPAVVFAHGRGGNHLNWWQQIPFFSKQHRCITFDHREFGLTREAPNGNGKERFVSDLAALLDHLSIEKVSLIGQSMGGWTCLGFALAFPERTRALVLTNTTGGIAEPSVLDVLIRRGDSPDRRTTALQFEEREPEKSFLLKQFRTLNESLNLPLRESRASFMTGADGPKKHDLARMTVPTLVIGAEQDELFPPEVMHAVAGLIPGSTLHMVDGAAHSVHFELPEKFNALVADFLNRHATR